MTNPSNNPLAPPQLPPQGDAQPMVTATPHAAVTVAAAPVFPTVANATAAALLHARNSGAAATTTANSTGVEQMSVSQKRLKIAQSLEGGELTEEEVLHHHAHFIGAGYTLAVTSGYVQVNPIFPTVANATAAAILNAHNGEANGTNKQRMAASRKRLKIAKGLKEQGKLTDDELLHHRAHFIGVGYTLAVEYGYVTRI